MTIFAIDATTGALIRVGADVPLPRIPRTLVVDPSGRFLYVGHEVSNLIDVADRVTTFAIDAATGGLTRVGTDVTVEDGPYSVSVDPTGRFAYVVNTDSDTLTTLAIDAPTGLPTVVAGGIVLPNFPLVGTFAPSGRFAYVANSAVHTVRTYSVSPIDGTPTMVGNDVVAGTTPLSIAIHPNGRFAYVASADSNNVTTFSINHTTGVLAAIDVKGTGPYPYSIAVDTGGRFAQVANYINGSVTPFTIDATSGLLTRVGPDILGRTQSAIDYQRRQAHASRSGVDDGRLPRSGCHQTIADLHARGIQHRARHSGRRGSGPSVAARDHVCLLQHDAWQLRGASRRHEWHVHGDVGGPCVRRHGDCHDCRHPDGGWCVAAAGRRQPLEFGGRCQPREQFG